MNPDNLWIVAAALFAVFVIALDNHITRRDRHREEQRRFRAKQLRMCGKLEGGLK